MENMRVWFKKEGPAKYISHLDLTRCMSRGLKLSGLPVWYTEGFNPRIYMTFAMPLALGVRGERECMDIRLTEPVLPETIVEKLRPKLPEGIVVYRAGQPIRKLEEAAFADYELRLEGTNVQVVENLLAQESVFVVKHGKKGDKEIDIKPHFEGMEMQTDEEGLLLKVRLPCGQEGSVNPSLLIDALNRFDGTEHYVEITRKRLLTKDFTEIE